jgi:hypothetical protein
MPVRTEFSEGTTVVVRPLAEFKKIAEDTADFPPMNLRKEAALKREIIDSGLHKFVDVDNLKVVFTDRLGDARRRNHH